MRARLCAALLAAIVATGCGRPGAVPDGARVVRVAAAADLKFALDEIAGILRHERPPVDLQVTYGSSGTLYTQIVNSAPFDIYLSADAEYPRQLAAQGFTAAGSEFVYALGRLAVVVPTTSPLDLSRGLAALGGAKRVAVANPAHAPYGRAALAAIRSAGIAETLSPRLVYGENVAQALQFVQSGAADAGIVALSLVSSPSVKGTLRYAEVPPAMFPELQQAGVVLKRARDMDAAMKVRAVLGSAVAAGVLRRYGFVVPAGRP